MQNKTFRLFISSTFSDLQEERNILQNEVFPEIKSYCKSFGYGFEPIDLRWGVSSEAGLDHKTMEICINEVEKVFNYPKPNFLIMLGNRYGWIPAPTEIEEIYFEQLIKAVSEHEKELLNKWYKKDVNSIPSQYVLQSIDHIIDDEKEYEQIWQKDENELVAIIVKHKALFPKELYIGKSATEQEIIKGVLESASKVEGEENVLCMVREISNLDVIDNPVFLGDDQTKLDDLKQRLKECKEPNVEYKKLQAKLVQKEEVLKPDKDYLEDYALEVKNFLINNIKKEIDRLGNNIKDIEDQTHEKFKSERSKIFIGREDILLTAINYIQNDIQNPFVIYGESGVGKSAFIAKLIKTIEDAKLDDIDLLYRFVGISELSSQPKMFLDNLIVELSQRLNQDTKVSSKDYSESINRFISMLHAYSNTSSKKLVVVIDALDQFETKTNLEWIESELPQNIKIIISTLPSEYGEYYNILKTKVIPQNIHKLEKLDLNDGKSIIDSWLESNHKKLTNEQLNHIYKMFEKNGLPLYLKIIFDQALTWRSYDDNYKELNETTLIEAIKSFFNNLVVKNHHAKMLAEHTLGYISASKNGLSENEIVEILSSDHIVMKDISNPYHKLSSNILSDKLPAAVWSRLYYDLLKYFTLVEFDGISLISFYHRKIKECSRDYYYTLNKEFYHTNLLEYFWNQPLVFEETKNVNLRKLSELPHHCIQSNSFSKFLDLYDTEFIGLKVQNNQLNNLLLEIYNISVNLMDSNVVDDYKRIILEKLSNNLLQYLILYIQEPSSELISAEDIHATLVYRENNVFYEIFLEISRNQKKLYTLINNANNSSVDKYYAAFSARYANKIRREAKLDEAAEIYTSLEKKALVNILDYFEQSRIYYDIGYIAYLSGEFDKAIKFMKKSADVADQPNSQVSRYISKCVGARIQMLRYGLVEDFENTLSTALRVFESNKFNDLSAKRWIKNVYAHLFEVAYAQKDTEKAEKYLDLLKSDDWMLDHQSVKKYSSFTPYEARLFVLKEDYEKAAHLFHGYIYEVINGKDRITKESMARDYFDYLVALQEMDHEKFLKEFDMALELPDRPGNHIWKEKIKKLIIQR